MSGDRSPDISRLRRIVEWHHGHVVDADMLRRERGVRQHRRRLQRRLCRRIDRVTDGAWQQIANKAERASVGPVLPRNPA